MALTRTQIIIVGGVVFLIIVAIIIGIVGLRPKTEKPPELKLTIWGIEDKNAFYESLTGYQTLRPNVQVRYNEMNPDAYENDLLNALAAGTGPDVFMFKNTWLPKHLNKIAPVTSETQLSLIQFQQLFPMVAEQDFAPGGLIYALPLFIDTLSLYSNTDIFNTAGIAFPPAAWLDFQSLVLKLRQIDKQGNITRAAAAIGGSSRTVDNAADILSLLMLQAGAEMTNEQFTQATFAEWIGEFRPGETALSFYTKFADPTNTYYTWNDNLNYSLDSFAQGKTAMMFGYAYQKKDLKQINPFLKFKTAPMLQPNIYETAVNYASYWGLAVANKSPNPEWAWDLALFLTTDEKTAENYFKFTNRPPALRSLIQKYINDPEIGVFAKQALSARSWPQIDEKAIAAAFSQMIEAVNNKQLEVDDALYQAQETINSLMRE